MQNTTLDVLSFQNFLEKKFIPRLQNLSFTIKAVPFVECRFLKTPSKSPPFDVNVLCPDKYANVYIFICTVQYTLFRPAVQEFRDFDRGQTVRKINQDFCGRLQANE